jgi:hypothetical protein
MVLLFFEKDNLVLEFDCDMNGFVGGVDDGSPVNII